MKSDSVSTCARTVREFMQVIIAQAKAALAGIDKPGFLQISQLHPCGGKLVSSRYAIDDVDCMTGDAVAGSNAGHNIYIEGRTLREGTAHGARGTLADTAAVFALVVDSDADKQMGWTPTVRPSVTVETSPGNFHYWFFLRNAVNAATGKLLGERIRQAVSCDHDTGNVVQPYRVAGTINYPGASKTKRGRVSVPTRLVEFNPGAVWTSEQIEQAFPLPARKTNGGDVSADGITNRKRTPPADTLEAICQGAPEGKRSDVFWNVVLVLKRVGWSVGDIVALMEEHPAGIAEKYRGRLRHEVERAYWKINVADSDSGPVFDPWERYVVPTFPFDVLPPVARDYVAEHAAVIGCDASALAMAVLATFSGALHHEFALKMMRHGKWYERPRLWVLLVGDPSQRKTPIMTTATRPLVEHETKLREKHDAEQRAYEAAKADGAAKKDDTKLPEPAPPPRYLVWDTTVEKLGELMARSPKGLLVSFDEIAGWLGNMERYQTGRSDRAFWLTSYDGGPRSIDRIKRGELFVKNLSASVLGGIQPTRLAELRGLTSDGLLQRFLPVMLKSANFPQDRPSKDDDYGKLVRAMIFARPERQIMTDMALVIMNDLRQHLFDLEQASAGLAVGFQSFIGKLHGLAGSLALILHMAHDPLYGAAQAVDEQTVEDVRRLIIDFIVPHAYEFYRTSETVTDGDRVQCIASWILTSGRTRILASDLTSNVAVCRGLSLKELNERVSPLVAAGWLQPTDNSPVCRSWLVAPQVHLQLAERARQEEARKGALADLMGSPRRSGKTT